jgi:hypothetical protein
LSSEVFIRGFISSLPQRAWDKKALLLLSSNRMPSRSFSVIKSINRYLSVLKICFCSLYLHVPYI